MYTVEYFYNPLKPFKTSHKDLYSALKNEGTRTFKELEKAQNFWNECTFPINAYPSGSIETEHLTNATDIEVSQGIFSYASSNYSWEESIARANNYNAKIKAIDNRQNYLRGKIERMKA
jgi:hypothetical protein